MSKVFKGKLAAIIAVAIAAMAVTAIMAGCSSSSSSSSASSSGSAASSSASSSSSSSSAAAELESIEIACLSRDVADVYYVAEQLADKYDISPLTIDDNNALNETVNGGDAPVSYWEDAGTMKKWNDANNGNLAAYGDPISCAPLMMVSRTYHTIDSIPQGATVVISDGAATQARALRMMEDAGLIVLNDVDTPSIYDLVENPYEFEFIEAASRDGWAVFADYDFLLGTGTTVLAGNDPDVTVADAICVEDIDDALAGGGVVLVTTEDIADDDPEWLQDIYDVMTSKAFDSFIQKTYGGAKLTAAGK